MKLPIKLSKKVAYSYLRHLVGIGYGILFAEAHFNLLKLTSLTAHDYRMALHATYLAAVFQLRFSVLPLVKRYVIKRYPQFVWVFNDAAVVVDKRLSEITPTQTSGDNNTQIGTPLVANGSASTETPSI